MRPTRKPSRSLPAWVQGLVAVAVVGAAAFYGGYRYGWMRARRELPRPLPAERGTAAHPPAAHPAAPQSPPPSEPANDVHFVPRQVDAVSGNFLSDPGFEEGGTGWKWLDWSQEWGPFEIASGHVATGVRALHLAAHGAPTDPATHVFGAVQEIVSAKFPTRISGRYYVERWEPGGAHKAYIQVVIIAMRTYGNQPTMQLRYILDGVTEPPYHMSNARYIFVHRRAEPEIGRWIDFSLDVQGDYRQQWGEVPPDGTGYRVLFEARYDDKPAGGTVNDDVWYDDLFVGTP